MADGHGAPSVHLSTTDRDAAGCPECGVFSRWCRSGATCAKDLPYGHTPLVVRWHKRQFACRQRLCKRKAFTESIAELPPRARITGRARRAAAVAVGSGRSVSAVTRELPMSRSRTRPSSRTPRRGRSNRPPGRCSGSTRPAVAASLDQERRRHVAPLGAVRDQLRGPAGAGGPLGQIAGRSAKTVTDWLDASGQGWKNAVQVVAIDPCAAYRTAVERALPHATIVADHFHLVRLANEMVTDVRQRVAREQLGRRGRKADPAWANRRLLLRAGVRPPPRALDRLTRTFVPASDPTGESAQPGGQGTPADAACRPGPARHRPPAAPLPRDRPGCRPAP